MEAKKLAIFTEGFTEQYFVEHLLRKVANEKSIQIEKTKSSGGRFQPRSSRRIEMDAFSETQKYYVLINDCGNDERVQSDIRDRYNSLIKQNFVAIIGIRDVYPRRHDEIPKVALYAKYKLPTAPVDPVIVLSIMEIEAWFLAEFDHFQKIDARLTLESVKAAISFDPSVEDVATRVHPAHDLDVIYKTVGKRYLKNSARIARTVRGLDMYRVYGELPERIPALNLLVSAIDSFLS